MNSETILIIEDEPEVSEIIQGVLKRDGFQVIACFDGKSGLATATQKRPSLVMLDIMMPGMSGLEVCRQMRQRSETRITPIILLTAKIDESDIVMGLGMGADDYVTKPFHSKELVARVKAVLRRHRIEQTAETRTQITEGPIHMDIARHEAKVEGKEISLTLAEFRILWALISSPGRVYTRNQLLDKITSGEGETVVDRNVDVHIGAIRKKIGEIASKSILTVRGIGYKFRASEVEELTQQAA